MIDGLLSIFSMFGYLATVISLFCFVVEWVLDLIF